MGPAVKSETKGTKPGPKAEAPLPASKGGDMLAALGGGGIVGILVVVLIVIAIIYFVRRA